MSLSEKKVIIHRWLRFILGGGINTAFTYGIYIALNMVINYQLAYLIAYSTGIIFAYWFNAVIVFKTPLSWKGLFFYPLVYVIQYFASALMLGVLVETWHLSEVLAPLIVTVGMIPITYVMSKLILTQTGRGHILSKIMKAYFDKSKQNHRIIKYIMCHESEYLNNAPLSINRDRPRSDKTCQILLAVTYFFVVAMWSSIINFNGAPDESTHFFLLEYLHAFKTMPTSEHPLLAFTGLISHYTWPPKIFWYYGLPFPHVVGGLFTASIGSMVLPESFLYMGVRAFNWMLASLFVIALFRIARQVGLSQSTSVISVIIVAMIPQVSFIFSYFNSDAYGLTTIAWALSSLLLYCASPTCMRSIILGASIGLLMLAKIYFLPALVFLGVTLLIGSLTGRIKSPRHYLVMSVTCTLFAAPMLIFIYSHFGEISGLSGQIDFVKLHKSNPTTLYGTCYYLCEQGLVVWGNLSPWLESTAKSYFSVTGWMSVLIPNYYYWTALLLILTLMMSSVILAIYIWRAERRFSFDYHLPLIMILGLFPSITMVSIMTSQNGLPQAQGRYLFVTIPFVLYLIALVVKRAEIALKIKISND